MSARHFEIRRCNACGLRYPLTDAGTFGERCPACLGTTRLVLSRDLLPLEQPPAPSSSSRAPRLSALLDNLRSAWSVGAIFRSADGLGVSKLYVCGITPTPDNKTMTKTSLGAEISVAWEYTWDAVQTAMKLKAEGYRLVAPAGTTYEPIDPGLECWDQMRGDGDMNITCKPDKELWSYELKVCNSACSAPALAIDTGQCPAGYGFDATNQSCAAPAPAAGDGCTVFKVDVGA